MLKRANYRGGRADPSRGSALTLLNSLVGRGGVVFQRFSGQMDCLPVLSKGRLILAARFGTKYAFVVVGR